jgi:ArsR family transcriptional regulator
MDEAEARALTNFLTALCDPTRLRLLSLMADRAVTVGFLTDSTGDSQPKVSRHLASLRSADLVSTERDGKHIYYALRWPDQPIYRQVVKALLNKNGEIPKLSQIDTDNISEETYTFNGRREEMEIYLL